MVEVAKPSKFRNTTKNMVRFFKEVRNELKKVIWPNRQQLTNNTTTVILCCLVIGAIIWIADFALLKISEVVFIR